MTARVSKNGKYEKKEPVVTTAFSLCQVAGTLSSQLTQLIHLLHSNCDLTPPFSTPSTCCSFTLIVPPLDLI
ncbi:hypothetical protein FPSE5266_20219 [Fusarium pseudograminearum]|nr:hypothetical protein FPSE5266_20219 [Fusarium pseudograminearum]